MTIPYEPLQPREHFRGVHRFRKNFKAMPVQGGVGNEVSGESLSRNQHDPELRQEGENLQGRLNAAGSWHDDVADDGVWPLGFCVTNG